MGSTSAPEAVNFPAMLFPEASSFEAVIFDCDGTLVDTMPLFFLAWRDSLERYGSHYDFQWEYFCNRGGQKTETTLEEICHTSHESIDFATLRRYQEEFLLPRLGEVTPITPVVQFAEQCHRLSQPLAVASGGYREYVHRTLSGIGIKEYFPVIVTCEDVKYTKPAPDLFLLAAEKLNVRPRYCLVIEDSPLGIQAASAAGMASYLLPMIHRGNLNKC
jgi:HAD superfamily hydrolase (TIGR01509 family)